MDPKLLTEEYILEQRRLRELRKEKIRQQKEALGLIPPPEKKVLKRPMLEVCKPKPGLPSIKIMSYNILAQTLIRRNIPYKWENIEMVCEVSDTIRRIETL